MNGIEGLICGQKVIDIGAPIKIPVRKGILGRIIVVRNFISSSLPNIFSASPSRTL
jgi:hypothetical protein